MLKTILQSLLLPPGSILVPSAFLFLIMPFFRWKCFLLFLLLIGMGALYLLSTSKGAHWLVSRLQAQPVLVLSDNLKTTTAQAIVVLGAPNTKSSPEYGHEVISACTLERVRFAARLAKVTNKPLLLSGGLTGGKITEAQAMQEALQQDFGFTQEVWLDTQSTDTTMNAKNSAAILKGKNINNIILVTQAMYMPRAVQEFTKQSLTVIAAPTGMVSWDAEELSSWMMWLPNYKNLFYSSRALQEYMSNFLSMVM